MVFQCAGRLEQPVAGGLGLERVAGRGNSARTGGRQSTSTTLVPNRRAR